MATKNATAKTYTARRREFEAALDADVRGTLDALIDRQLHAGAAALPQSSFGTVYALVADALARQAAEVSSVARATAA